MEAVLALQFIAHLLADFFFQPEHWSESKQKHCHRSTKIYLHALVVLTTSILATPSWSFLLFSVLIAVVHLAVDIAKSLIERYCVKRKNIEADPSRLYVNPYIFIADQLLHFVIIYAVVALYVGCCTIPQLIANISLYHLAVILGFLLCAKPANVFIRILLSSLNLPIEEESNTNNKDEKQRIQDLERAGRWIGSAERILTYVFVLMGEFTAIGFVITAKSILRFNDRSLRKTEYVLVGTLLSFAIAILLGLVVEQGILISFLEWISCK